MEIYLNGQPLDFRLESERTLAQVSAELEKWLAKGGLCLVGLRADGRDVGWGPGSPTLEMPVTQVTRLDCAVAPPSEARLATLRTTVQYVRLFHGALGTKDPKLLGELSVGYPSLVESIRALLSPQPGDDLHTRLLALDRMLAGSTPERIAAWPDADLAAARGTLETLGQALERKTREWDDPTAALTGIRESLERAVEETTEVSVLLQTGREREAMARVIAFSELAQNHLAVVQRILDNTGRPLPTVGDQSFAAFGESLNTVLQQLLEAFHGRDTVLIGDLLEYEVAPRIRRLTQSTHELERPPVSGA